MRGYTNNTDLSPADLASRRARAAALADGNAGAPSVADVGVPIDATGSELAAQTRMFLLQFIPSVGLLLTALGFSEGSRVIQIWRFLNTEPAIPIITAAASAFAFVWGQIRARRRQRSLQTLALLPTTPDTVAVGPKNPSAAVALAVEAATVVIDQQGAGQPPIDQSTGR